MLGLDWEEEEEETTPLVRLQSPDTICAGLPVCVSVRTNRPSPAALSEEVKGKHLSSVYLFAKWGGIISPTFRFFFLLLPPPSPQTRRNTRLLLLLPGIT